MKPNLKFIQILSKPGKGSYKKNTVFASTIQKEEP